MAEQNVCDSSQHVCFVLMPISDVQNYDSGHFGRVYEYLIKPAIEKAGYVAVRSDDTAKTDDIVVSIIQKIINSEMVLCDFSARNPNVMYELGLRHAFAKPVTLIKDNATERVFDIQGIRYTEYNKALRVDTVEKDCQKICAAINETAKQSPDGINSVVQLAGIIPAAMPERKTITQDTELILSVLHSLESRIDALDQKSSAKARFFRIVDDTVSLGENDLVNIGDKVYDGKGNEIGTLVDIHPFEGKIFIRNPQGKVFTYSANSILSRDLTSCPF